ncbi:conserved alanine rich domain protein [Mycobacterium kansasii]|uniref:Conserved alanine rich domain protein n=1 Tax=Mycobacterium kansasii TaxID=1768 RepID=A0A1V3WEG4_MYCKA|nr:conserved alanine rich domain protein [Mycobacterium kansasii]
MIALNSTFKNKPLVDIDEAEQEFTGKIPGVSVVRIPYDVHLAESRDVTFVELKSRARKALMALAGAIAQHYPARGPLQHRTTDTGGFNRWIRPLLPAKSASPSSVKTPPWTWPCRPHWPSGN